MMSIKTILATRHAQSRARKKQRLGPGESSPAVLLSPNSFDS